MVWLILVLGIFISGSGFVKGKMWWIDFGDDKNGKDRVVWG